MRFFGFILLLGLGFIYPVDGLARQATPPLEPDLFFDRPEPSSKAASTQALDDLYAEWEGEPRWLGGIDWGGGAFFGSIGYGRFFFTSSVPDDGHVPVEIRLSSTETTLAQTFRRDWGYIPGGVGVFPGAAYDISDPNQPRRLNIGFVEDETQGAVNQLWDPDESSRGKREYLFIMNSDYDGTGETYNATNIRDDAPDVLYMWWPQRIPDEPPFASDPATLRIWTSPFQNFHGLPDDGQVTLNWTFDKPDVDEVRLLAGTTDPPTEIVGRFSPSTRTFTHTGLINLIRYYYRLEAVTAAGDVRYISAPFSVAPQIVSDRVNLLGFWNGRRRYGDTWGYTDAVTGREYALLCARGEGLSIIDITESPPIEVGFAPGLFPNVDSKDVKVYQHYAILINENADAQVIDLRDPTQPVTVSTIPLPLGQGAHNAYVDGAYLYIVGAHDTGGLRIYDMTDPTNPTLVSTFEPYYYHDVYVRNDTAYAAAISRNNGVDILDLTDKTNPQLIVNFSYPGSGAHNAWTTEDGRYLFVGDETGIAGNHTRVFDLSDLTDVRHVADYIVNPECRYA